MKKSDLRRLVVAMRDNIYKVMKFDEKTYGEHSVEVECDRSRWLALHEVTMLISDDDYAKDIWKIFIKEDDKNA